MDAQEFAMPLAEPAALEAAAGNKTKKRKRRRRGSAASDSASPDNSTLLHSSLSLKKRLFLKKLAKRTQWYDANELLEAGRGLLLAAKLFPSPPPAVDSVNAAGAPNEQPTATNDGGPAPPPGLTPEEHQKLRTALRRVAVWRGRSERGRLPHAIDVTAGLAGTLLADAEQQISSGNAATFAATNATTPHQLRNAYAALLLRSVNGLADSYRSKSASLSVSHACALAGLPGWIVDVRHDASHGDLPGAGVCRIAAIESLRFWGGGYWRGTEGRVWGRNVGEGGDEVAGIGTRAAECLERYREAAVKEAQERARDPLAVGNRTKEAAGAKDGKEQEGEEDLILIPSKTKSGKDRVEKESASSDAEKRAPKKAIPDRTGGGPIPWWVLDDDKPKKRKKTKATAEDAEPEGAAGEDEEKGAGGAEMERTGASVAPGAEHKESAPADAPADAPSARDCAAEFVRTISVDIAFSTALRFLVWGGEQHGPALLTLPPDMVVPDCYASFDALRGICEPLLIAITNAYPGFVAALFVHLADSILCLDEARRNQHVDAELADGALDLHSLDRNVRCLVRWVRHVLSRQFHMHFDRSVAMYRPPPHPVANAPGFNAAKPDRDGQKQQPQAIDLKKKRRRNWTAAELEYMQGPLDFEHLDKIGLPLNAVCDRLRSHQKAANAGAVLGELQQLLEGVVGESRVVCMGLEEETPAIATGADHIPQPEVDSEDRQSSAMLSLEDMEAILGNEAKAANDTSRASVPPLGTDKTAGDGPSRAITPWKVCERWDSCAIGTMPGHPG